MARIISQINPETGRRQKVGSVEGKSFADRTENLATAFDTTPKKASRLSNAQISKKIQPSSIPLTTLTSSAEPAQVPQTTTSAPAQIDSMLSALPETLKTQRQQTQNVEQTSFESLMSEALGQDTPSAIRARIEKEQGIQELDLQATELSNQLLAEQEALRKKIEQIETAPGTATLGERDREIAEITRVSRRQQADLAITQLAAQGRLDSARRFADAVIQAEVEEGQKRINVLQMAYERNKELFTRAEQREFETMQADRERELDKQTYEFKARLDQKIKQSDPLYQAQLQNELNKVGSNPNGTLNGKPQTQAQATAQGYADRTNESDQIISKMGNKFTSLGSYAYSFGAPNFLKSADRQLYEQAQRNFINAVLRRESGAVISDQEFANARLQYFPQPGDSDAVVAQKAQNRQTVINNLYREGNTPRMAMPGDIIYDDAGQSYLVGDDGETLTPL